MEAALREMLPEVNDIQDKALQKKVLKVWEKAMEWRGWIDKDLKVMPFTLLVKDVTITFVEHVRVVCRMCMAMDDVMRPAYGDRYKVDRDTLIAGALLADVGKLLEFERKDGKFVKSQSGDYLRHPFSGVGLAWAEGVPEAVMHIIACHSKEGDHVKRTAEAIIFHHADFTDFDLSK